MESQVDVGLEVLHSETLRHLVPESESCFVNEQIVQES